MVLSTYPDVDNGVTLSYKATPVGIPVSGPVQTEKDMQACGCHY